MRVHLEYAHTLDPVLWRERHTAGLVPDRFPYGLDWLGDHGFDLYTKRPANGVASFLSGIGRRASGGFELVEAMRSRVRRSCDAALCWDERAGVPAALRSRLPGEPPALFGIIWLTEPDAPGGRRARTLAREALRKAAGVWAMSPAQLVVLQRDWGVDSKRLHLLHMGIDVDFWHAAGTPSEPELVVGGGNDRHRDHLLLVEAIARLRRRRPNVRLELVTRQPIDIPPELGVRHEHLSHPEMRDLYGRASVVALALKPNLHLSGLSVLLETMACARPLVITASPGLSEYTRDAETALFVPPHEADALADGIDALLSDPGRAAALAHAGRAVTDRFSTKVQATQLATIIRDAMG